jgi:thiamine biosynthesis lipoprotein
VVIDVGAVGNGHLVDLIAAILRDAGVGWFVVDGSGDLRQVNEAGIRVGLEHPFDPRRVVGVVPLTNTALCASAPNRRAWGAGSHHLLDARTGTPVRDVVATFVIADDAAVADGLATALFVTEAARLTETFTFTYVRILADGRVKSSPDFAGELFT